MAQTEEAARLEQPLPSTPEKEPLTPPAETQEPAEPDPAPLPGAEGAETVSGAQPSRTPAAVAHLSEMSVEFQAGLPDLRFSGHVYSPVPELRMILINDSVVREGQQIDTGLTLFEITETGVILRAGQSLFRIELL